jgi:glucans biosynthesis protein
LVVAMFAGMADIDTTLAAETASGVRASDLAQIVEARAEQLAGMPFEPSPKLPEAMSKLDYDDYRFIAFEPQRALWKNSDSPFRIEFFHRGYLYPERVAFHVDHAGRDERLKFDPRMFQYRGRLASMAVGDDIGFAGFRVLGKFASSTNFAEIASFLGASYFRAVGEGQTYGISARGLAVDVGLPKAEEFPAFREFWIEQPRAGDRSLTFAALLDGPSVTGAYHFVLTPDRATTFEVRAKLFFRRRPEKIGLAPLSSMWMWGDGLPGPANDPRPEVHDSDGLLVQTADDEWIWRPLTRLDYPSLSHFDFAGVRGFGLLQRDRTPDHYHDSEANYSLRPSVWIEPKQPWLAGAVELLELPADHEGSDNIAAWWTPKESVDPTKPLELSYTISFLDEEPQRRGLCRAVDFQITHLDAKTTRIAVTFERESPTADSSDPRIVPDVSILRGQLVAQRCDIRPDGMLRLTIDFRPDGNEPVELRAVLTQDGRSISETWRYLCRN